MSIIIPCFNEVKTVKTIIDLVKDSSYPDKEIIIIDDCSTDGSRELLKSDLASKVDKVIFHDKNSGKGTARSGIGVATGDLVIIQDADLEYDPNEYEKMGLPILEGNADIVFGSRFIGAEPHRVLFFWHRLGNAFLTFLSNMFTNLNLTDMETCYKMFRREIIQSIRIEENRFGFEPEVTAKIAKLGCRIYEVGISYHGRTYDEGKKINWKDGFRAVYCILKYNLLR